MDLIGIIIFFVFISKILKKGQDEKDRIQRNVQQQQQNPWDTVVGSSANSGSTSRNSYGQSYGSQVKRNQETARTTIENTKRRLQEKYREVERELVQAGNTTILQRAKANADEDKVDVTLQTMEAEHNHSERVSEAVHHHPEDEIPENMLGKIEDLMIKGYDGNLCFERDFVGEALDMINRFTISTDIPTPSTKEVI